MPDILVTYDPFAVRIGLAILIILVLAGYAVFYARRSRKERARTAARAAAGPPARPQLFTHSLHAGSTLLGDVMRGLLIVLALCVAAGFIVIVLPEGTFGRIEQSIRARHPEPPQQERISLLYLGDEVKGKEFHVRGAIRNISTQPIERLDAMVRLYASDGILLETAVVRMDTENIAPDATSTFHLVYPDYAGQFGSYSVDFKLRQGESLPYKDMRSNRSAG